MHDAPASDTCRWCGDGDATPGKWGSLCNRCFWDLVREKGRK